MELYNGRPTDLTVEPKVIPSSAVPYDTESPIVTAASGRPRE